MLTLMTPLFFIMLFRRFAYKLFFSFNKESYVDWNRKIDTLSLTIIFPGMIYNLGFISIEVLFVVVSFFAFLFWSRLILLSITLYLLYLIDDGNFIVIFLFVIGLKLFEKLYKLLGIRLYKYFLILFTLFSYFYGQILINIVSELLNFEKLTHIVFQINDGGYFTNIPLYLRPVIIFFSSIIFTPHGAKSIFLYILIVILLIYALFIAYSKRKSFVGINQISFHELNESQWARFYTVISLLSSFVFYIPTHANAKYYLFLFPFLIYFFLQYFGRQKIMFFFSIGSLVMLTNFLLYYL